MLHPRKEAVDDAEDMETAMNRRIEVGGFRYELVFDDQLFRQHQATGYCQNDICRISIDDTCNEHAQVVSYFHEIVHAICWCLRMTTVSDDETERLAQGLAQANNQIISPTEFVRLLKEGP